MSVSTDTNVGGNKRPSPESNSVIDRDSVSKKDRGQRHIFTPLENEVLTNLYHTNKLKNTQSIHKYKMWFSIYPKMTGPCQKRK
jgi:hypothetical protein